MNNFPPKPLLPPCNGSHATPWATAAANTVPEYLFMCRCELGNAVPLEYDDDATISLTTFQWACTWPRCTQRFHFVVIMDWTISWLAEQARVDRANLHPECVVAWSGLMLERLVRNHYIRHFSETDIQIVRIGGVVSLIFRSMEPGRELISVNSITPAGEHQRRRSNDAALWVSRRACRERSIG